MSNSSQAETADNRVHKQEKDAALELKRHHIGKNLPIYAIGSFDSHVTVLSQQTRALNLVWALVESGMIPSEPDGRPYKVAIVGGGFAGVTTAAGLIEKGMNCEITLFEQRDTLLPLQQGSDTRWLHPHIYEWPAPGSEATAAMLPVLNWTAARSSDVVVQILSEWSRLIQDEKPVLDLYCDVRHLQVSACADDGGKARLEWVGELRDEKDGTGRAEGSPARGSTDSFDAVILAVGFGIEASGGSYWRNEMIGQPGLNGTRRTFLLSGQGDGAMIDLLRIRISRFRQDRILDELFGDLPDVVAALEELRKTFSQTGTGLFENFEALSRDSSPHASSMSEVLKRLSNRLRRDTDVILGLLVRNIAELLDAETSRMSFQNALLVYLLYKSGGFAPTRESAEAVKERYGIDADAVIKRHGVKPLDQFKRVLPDTEMIHLKEMRKKEPDSFGTQSSTSLWPGGYFGYDGPTADKGKFGDETRRTWRKEYLPDPTSVIANTLCGAISGAIARMQPKAKHFRVTMHRTIALSDEELLQQCCDYSGRKLKNATGTAGRTMQANFATIGAAYRLRQIVRSKRGETSQTIQSGMKALNLEKVSRTNPDVSFLLTIPLLQPDDDHYAPSPVAGTIYIDSQDRDFWLGDSHVEELCGMIEQSIQSLISPETSSLGRIRNFPVEPVQASPDRPAEKTLGVEVLEQLTDIKPPQTGKRFVMNFDQTDLAKVVRHVKGIF